MERLDVTLAVGDLGFLEVDRRQDERARIKLTTMWQEAGLGELPEPEEPTE